MDTFFFIGSKLFWAAVRVESWFLIFLLIALYHLSFGDRAKAQRWLTGVIAAFLAIGWLPIGDLFIKPLETRIQTTDVSANLQLDGILVLGGGENGLLSAHWNSPQLNQAAERVVTAAALARRQTTAQVLFTGGSPRLTEQQAKGAYAAQTVLTELGVPQAQLLLEPEARNTFENAAFSLQIVPNAPKERWLLITSAFHMPRAIGVFCQLDWPILPYAVDYRSGPFTARIVWAPGDHLDTFNTAIREWVGLVAYRLTKRSSALLPRTCAQPAQ